MARRPLLTEDQWARLLAPPTDQREIVRYWPSKNIRVTRGKVGRNPGLELGVFGPNISRAIFEQRCFILDGTDV
jgi:hypothetical protein